MLQRFGPGGAATTAFGGLLALLVATVWLPGGQADGVRLMGQGTPAVLTLATLAAVLLATFVILQTLAALPPRARLIAQAVFVVVGAYAVLALAAALRDGASYPALFHGGAAWSRLPSWLQGTFIGVFGLVPLALVAQLVRVVAYRKRRQPLKALARQALALVLVFAMSLAGVNFPQAAPAAQPGAPTAAWRPPAGQLGAMFRALEAAKKKLDRTSFEPRALVDKVGGDAAVLFEWVRDNTYWVPRWAGSTACWEARQSPRTRPTAC